MLGTEGLQGALGSVLCELRGAARDRCKLLPAAEMQGIPHCSGPPLAHRRVVRFPLKSPIACPACVPARFRYRWEAICLLPAWTWMVVVKLCTSCPYRTSCPTTPNAAPQPGPSPSLRYPPLHLGVYDAAFHLLSSSLLAPSGALAASLWRLFGNQVFARRRVC